MKLDLLDVIPASHPFNKANIYGSVSGSFWVDFLREKFAVSYFMFLKFIKSNANVIFNVIFEILNFLEILSKKFFFPNKKSVVTFVQTI